MRAAMNRSVGSRSGQRRDCEDERMVTDECAHRSESLERDVLLGTVEVV